MQISAAIYARQRVRRGAVRRNHIQHKPERVRSHLAPGQSWHDVMGMYVDDELAPTVQCVLAGRQILRRRNAVAAAWPRAGQAPPRTAARGHIERREQGGHPAGRLQESPPVDAQPVRGQGGPRKHCLR